MCNSPRLTQSPPTGDTIPTSKATAVSHLLESILTLHGVVIYLLVAALVFGEAAIFVGFVLPGETAVVLGGVLAHRGQVSLPLLLVIVVAAAVVGDSIGYEVGRLFGPRLLRTKLFRRRESQLSKAQRFLRRNGGLAVILGRFTAFLRAVMPGLAGMSGLHYRKFLLFNFIGGLIWGTLFTLVGYLAGASYERVEKLIGRGALVVFGIIVLALVALMVVRRRRERLLAKPETPDSENVGSAQ